MKIGSGPHLEGVRMLVSDFFPRVPRNAARNDDVKWRLTEVRQSDWAEWRSYSHNGMDGNAVYGQTFK